LHKDGRGFSDSGQPCQTIISKVMSLGASKGRVAQIQQERGQPCPRFAKTLGEHQNPGKWITPTQRSRAPGLWATRPQVVPEPRFLFGFGMTY